jgi:O-methyltransferase
MLWNQTVETLARQIPGCFVECGVARGGSSAVMGLAIRRSGQARDLHLFDSFEGLPEPTDLDGAAAREYSGGRASGALESIHRCEATLEEVRQVLLVRLGLDRNRVHFHVGWFQNTVPSAGSQIGPIALLRLDGDWYESTRICLDHLYPHLSIGGIVIMDDYYAWEGCRRATDEYRAAHGITSPLTRIDCDAAYWTKDQAS